MLQKCCSIGRRYHFSSKTKLLKHGTDPVIVTQHGFVTVRKREMGFEMHSLFRIQQAFAGSRGYEMRSHVSYLLGPDYIFPASIPCGIFITRDPFCNPHIACCRFNFPLLGLVCVRAKIPAIGSEGTLAPYLGLLQHLSHSQEWPLRRRLQPWLPEFIHISERNPFGNASCS